MLELEVRPKRHVIGISEREDPCGFALESPEVDSVQRQHRKKSRKSFCVNAMVEAIGFMKPSLFDELRTQPFPPVVPIPSHNYRPIGGECV
jgi:hypothetical protein